MNDSDQLDVVLTDLWCKEKLSDRIYYAFRKAPDWVSLPVTVGDMRRALCEPTRTRRLLKTPNIGTGSLKELRALFLSEDSSQ